MNIQELKRKYSGQAVPEWELKQLEQASEKPKKKAKAPDPEPEAPASE